MKIKKTYSPPLIEEHQIDQIFCWTNKSDPITITGGSVDESKTPSEGPSFENPSAADYPFGGDNPDYTNM